MTVACTDHNLERRYLAFLILVGSVPDATALSVTDYAASEHQKIAGAIAAVVARGETIDPYTVEVELKRTLGANAPLALLAELAQTPVRLDVEAMGSRLRSLAHSRRMREVLLLAANEVEKENHEAAVEHARIAIDDAPDASGQIESADVVARLGWHEYQQGKEQAACRTGLPILDGAIGSLRPGTATILGGRTGSGKSSLVLTIAVNACRRTRTKVGIVSCEDARSVWGPRVLGHLLPGVIEDTYNDALLEDAFAEARAMGLHFAFRLNRPLGDVVGAVRSMARMGCGLVVVDYLQAIRFDAVRESRHVPMSNAAQAIKSEAQAHNIALIMCSQLKRSSESPFREPTAQDLKESGDLENLAEVVMLLWNQSDREDDPALGKIAKVKWSPKRPRFQIDRSPTTGVVTGVSHVEAPAQSKGRFQA